MRFALVCLLSLTGTAFAAPSVTVQDLRDVANGDLEPEDVVTMIPPKDRLKAIHQLLRTGASCKRGDVCSDYADYAPPGEHDTERSPCFRRWYLFSLLRGLGGEELVLTPTELRAVMKLDDEIVAEIGMLLSEPQQVELARLYDKQQRPLPFDLMIEPDIAADAVKRYHLDAAVAFVDAQKHDLLIRVVLDPTYKVATRRDALDRLYNDPDMNRDTLAAIIRPLVADMSLEVAADVANLLSIDVRRPPTRDRSLFMHALMLAVNANLDDPEVGATYAPRGIDIIGFDGSITDHLIDDLTGVIAERIRYQPPLFGTDKLGNVILVGFIDTPPPPDPVDPCNSNTSSYEMLP